MAGTEGRLSQLGQSGLSHRDTREEPESRPRYYVDADPVKTPFDSLRSLRAGPRRQDGRVTSRWPTLSRTTTNVRHRSGGSPKRGARSARLGVVARRQRATPPIETTRTATGMRGPLHDAGACAAASAASGPATRPPHTTVEITFLNILAMGTSLRGRLFAVMRPAAVRAEHPQCNSDFVTRPSRNQRGAAGLLAAFGREPRFLFPSVRDFAPKGRTRPQLS